MKWQATLTSEHSCGSHMEGYCDGSRSASGAAASSARCAAAGRDDEAGGAPVVAREAIASGDGGQDGSIAPGEVVGTELGAVAPGVLLGQRTGRWGELLHDSDEAVGLVCDGGDEGSEGGRGAGIGSSCDSGQELLEECERGRGDVERSLSLPDDERVVELFGDGHGRQVPWLIRQMLAEVNV